MPLLTAAQAVNGVSITGPGPWIDVTAYGAKADLQGASSCTAVNATKTISCPSNPFSAADVGKAVAVANSSGGSCTNDFVTLVVNFNSGTGQITYRDALPCLPGAGAATVFWGTDNTTAFTNAISAAKTTGSTIYFPYSGTGNYYVSGELKLAASGMPPTPPGVRFVGECGAPLGAFAPANSWGPVTCSTLVSDQQITFLSIGDSSGNSGTKYHSGLLIQDLGFRDISVRGDQVKGGIALYDTEDFNLTNIRIDRIGMPATSAPCNSGTTPCGFGILFDGAAGSPGPYTQFGVVVNPSIFNTRFPIQSNNQTSEINVYGGSLICTTDSTNTPAIGLDLGKSFHDATETTGGEWGVYGTHILNCATAAVSLFNNSVLQFYGVAEQATGTSFARLGTGIVVDGDVTTPQPPGGEFIGGSLNNFEVGVDIKGTAANNVIAASVTNNNTGLKLEGSSSLNTKVLGTISSTNTAQLSASGSPLSSLLILTNGNYCPSGSGCGASNVAVGSQIPTDLSFSTPEALPLTPTSGTMVYVDSGSKHLTAVRSDSTTADLEAGLLNYQKAGNPIPGQGTGTDLTVYTFSVPPIPAGKGIRARVFWTCSPCSNGAKTFKWQFGGSAVAYAPTSNTSSSLSYTEVRIFNDPGSQSAQTLFGDPILIGANFQTIGTTSNLTVSTSTAQTLNFVFNALSSETINPKGFIVEAIQ